MIVYEYPLNERIRTLLRLEDLFERLGVFLARDDALDHHVVMLTLFEIIEVASRADLKSALLQELEHQRQVLTVFCNNPDIAEDVLLQVLGDIERASASLFSMTGKIGQHVRENEWLMSIKQRSSIPGGTSEFDLPSYHHWRHRNVSERSADLQLWVAPTLAIRDAGAIVLKLLREGGNPARHIATLGTFSQMLGGRVAQLVRIRLARETQAIPEISANKYALNIRFIVLEADRTRGCDTDVEFELTFCNL